MACHSTPAPRPSSTTVAALVPRADARHAAAARTNVAGEVTPSRASATTVATTSAHALALTPSRNLRVHVQARSRGSSRVSTATPTNARKKNR